MAKRTLHPNSRKNLRIIRTHEEAVERGAAGGKARTERKRWNTIRNCTQKCPYHDRCPLISMSQLNHGKCVLHSKKAVSATGQEKALSQEVINAFFNLFSRGKEGLIDEALSALYKMRLKSTNATPKELKDLVSSMLDFKKAVYGEKIEHSGKIEAEVTHDISDQILNDPEAADLACKLFERIAVGKGDARRSGEDSKQPPVGTPPAPGANKQKAP